MTFAREHFRRFARYNAWANERLYKSCFALSEAEYMKPRPAFFKGIHGTLNHLLLTDRMWFARFDHKSYPVKSLDQQLYADRVGLEVARRAEDAHIVNYVDGLSEADIEAPLTYTNSRGMPFTNPLGLLLAHVFNHQTHHRGQVSDLIAQTDVPTPELDLIIYTRMSGG
ncbi:MAG TPA: DinB family protein [Candidatus Sulfotelmatobacter sp.]|nr:DinB family protein [Candidatus Sulfotelmatobacter sp.]